MRKMILAAALGLMVLNGGVAYAAKTWDDMSWWGNTGAKPEPKSDSKCRTGCWWLPVAAAKNEQDGELWGNRGVVFHVWKKPLKKSENAEPETSSKVPPSIDYALIINNILFDFGKAVLQPSGRASVDAVIGRMKRYPKSNGYGRETVTIEGHASSEGDEAYNLALGLQRAETVRKYMIESGIEPSRITTISYGETRPCVPNDTPANRKLNRRVEFRYVQRYP